MFDQIDKKVLANQMKAMILDLPARGDHELVRLKGKAISRLQDFESTSCMWRGWLFDEVVQAHAPDRLVLEGDQLVYLPQHDRPGEAVSTLLAVLDDYTTKAGCPQPSDPPALDGWLTVAEAAEFLGVTMRTMKKYLYETYQLTGELKGDTLLISLTELNAFKALDRPVGRPRKSS